MRPLKTFQEFQNIGLIRRRKPDIARAKSLIDEALKRRKFIDSLLMNLGVNEDNANYFLENSYDALMELLRAKLFVDGFYVSGEGAHEAEVAYLRELGFIEKDVRFLNELRFYRNGILYYGKNFGKDYARKVIDFLDVMYPKLRNFLKEL